MSRKPDELFSVAPVSTSSAEVDRDNRMIYGAKIIELGQINDPRGWVVDEATLAQVSELMAQPNKGLKARYTHSAALGQDGLQTHLGRWVNPRIEGSTVRADLKLSEAATKSPSGNLVEYVMSLAEEDPESFGVSVAGMLSRDMFEAESDEVFVRFSRLWSADVVGDPAATRGGLFNQQPEKECGMAENQEATQDTDQGGNLSVELAADQFRAEAQPYIEAFGAKGAQAYLEGLDLLSCYKIALSDEVKAREALQSRVEELETQLEAALAEDGEHEPLSSEERIEEDQETLERKRKAEELQKIGAEKGVAIWASRYK